MPSPHIKSKHPPHNLHTTKWGFQAQQKVDEISGEGNHYTAEYWEMDPRLGRRWNQDPVVKHWMSPYHVFSNNPIAKTDPLGSTDDWVKDEKTGEYTWDKNVTSKANTPEGKKYVGKNDVDVVKDIFEKPNTENSTTDLGGMGVENEDNVFVANYNGTIDTKLKITAIPLVDTKYNKKGEVESKEFNGVELFGTVVSNMNAVIPGGNPDMKLSNANLTVNGKQMESKELSGNSMTEAGNLPSIHFARTLNADKIQAYSQKSGLLYFHLKGLYASDTDYLKMPSWLQLSGLPNYTEVSTTLKFK